VDDAFLRQILAHPFDDGPRLVWADALDERGECARAEFVRVQCELERWKNGEGGVWCFHDLTMPAHCPRCKLRRRERELLGDLCPVLLAGLPDTPAVMIGGDYHYDRPFYGDHSLYRVEFDRGLVGGITLTAVQFFGGPCEKCGGSGYVLNEEAAAYDEQVGRHPMAPPAMPCPACRDPETGESTGRVEGLAAALFHAAPVTEVRLSDREPLRIFDGWGFSRGSAGTRRPEMTRHVLPPEVFDLIPTARDHLDEHLEAGWIRFRNKVTGAPEELLFLTPDRAHAALSVACVTYGRSSVHPPAAESKR
jgi:uncharacterized protein (TIGR02996 family)